MRSAATLIASLLPPAVSGHILQITGGRHLAALNDGLRPAANPELPAIARMLPASAAGQIVRVANRTESDRDSQPEAEILHPADSPREGKPPPCKPMTRS